VFPNPQDALPLPPDTDLAAARRTVEKLVAAHHGASVERWARDWVTALVALQPVAIRFRDRDVERRIVSVTAFATEQLAATASVSTTAHLIIARCHGFGSWTKLVQHIERLEDKASSVARFEWAADAIVDGEIDDLRRLLDADAALVDARSTLEHRATLLHHVAANGVEDFRQHTPANIVAIARMLLDAGAEVDATAEMYGGGATTLGLVVTSAHPRAAGVQIGLTDLLLERGAVLDKAMPRAALHNGCPEAAAHLVGRGAAADLEVAAGIGRLDLVTAQLADASPAEAIAALVMASWYGERGVVEVMLDHGVDPGARDPDDGKTALHLAAYHGNAPLVRLLLEHGAPVEVTDDRYHTPPLVWALHAWLVEGRGDAADYRTVLLTLVAAGATVQPAWVDDDRIRADAELDAALHERSA
jgi:ankyrin repeat protein